MGGGTLNAYYCWLGSGGLGGTKRFDVTLGISGGEGCVWVSETEWIES